MFRPFTEMIAEGLRPEDDVVDFTLWGAGRQPPTDQQPPALVPAAGNADTTVNTFDAPACTSARSAARAVMTRPMRGGGGGVLEDGESEDEVTEEPEENEKMLPGPVGSQVLGRDGRPVAPSTNPRYGNFETTLVDLVDAKLVVVSAVTPFWGYPTRPVRCDTIRPNP